jgi:hypothetical protein
LTFLLPACLPEGDGDSSLADVGESCARDSDCYDDLICAFGEEGFEVCMEPDANNAGNNAGNNDANNAGNNDANNAVNNDANNAGNNAGNNDANNDQEPGGACEQDQDCPGVQICYPVNDALICVETCTSDLDCDSGEYCNTDSVCQVDPCAANPGPACCVWANDGVCDEPNLCALGTDGDDCEEDGPVVEGQCPEGTPVLGEAGQTLTQVVELEWDSFGDDVSWISQPLYVELPQDIDSLSLTAYTPGVVTAWNGLQLNDEALTVLSGGALASSVVLPYNDASAPGAGCLSMLPIAAGDQRGETLQIFLTSRRQQPQDPFYTLNVIFVGELSASEDDIVEAVSLAQQIYVDNGAPRFEAAFYNLDTTNSWSLEELDTLRAVVAGEDPLALNLFVIEDFAGESLYGIAGGVPGPVGVNGVETSGVVVGLDAHYIQDSQGNWLLDTEEMGSTIGHELGHQLGLFHTTESTGDQFDPISDTPQCRTNGGDALPDDCPDGDLMMFWTAGSTLQTRISPIQVEVLRANPAAQ